ncbi:hypothetical protein ABZ915_15560 [Streptomyces sp. NPDC046915]|uniref:hypothetical protein n=1 Tax=Streptomyces sp. NPDC046915 TaxID=3155257 RepID=UPI0033FA02D5
MISAEMQWTFVIFLSVTVLFQKALAARKDLIATLVRTVQRYEKEEEKTLKQITGDLEQLRTVLDDALERLETLTESMERFEDRKRQYLRVRTNVERFFPGAGRSGLGGFVFATITNFSEDPITDCQVELLVNDEAGGTCHVAYVPARKSRDLRYRLPGDCAADDRIDFAVTFTDYYSRRWLLRPDRDAQELV